jgi:hypothetical protein
MRWSMGLLSSFDLQGSNRALALKHLDADKVSEVDEKPCLQTSIRTVLKLVDTLLNRRQ